MSYPLGAVIHYTAGRASSEEDALGTFNYMIEKKYKAVVIGPSGKAYFPPNWDTVPGAHAGPSYHPRLGRGLSRLLVGFEIACEGKVTLKKDGKFYSWFGTVIPKERINYYPQKTGNIEPGYYASFYTPQIDRLIELLLFLKNKHKSFSFENVFGHDEICYPPGRKADPGGSLGMTMNEFRSLLKKRAS